MTPSPTGDSAHEPPEAGDGTVLGSFHGLSAAPDAGLEQVGDEIGPYRILSQLGEGGFGTVFLAERREPFVQRVALKLVKPGMDSRAVIARFEQERQALAVMDHPGIARVLDGGLTPPGAPVLRHGVRQGRHDHRLLRCSPPLPPRPPTPLREGLRSGPARPSQGADPPRHQAHQRAGLR